MLVTIHCDASMKNQPGEVGAGGFVARDGVKIQLGGKLNSEYRNINEGELAAIGFIVSKAIKAKIIQPGDKILIKSDSQWAINNLRDGKHDLARLIKNIVSREGVHICKAEWTEGHVKLKDQDGNEVNNPSGWANRVAHRQAKKGLRK